MSDLFPLVLDEAETARRGKVLFGPASHEFAPDGISVVIGPNGSGKTSFLRLINGAARLTRGAIHWACPTDQARQAQAFVFQHPVMLRRSVSENLAYPLQMRRKENQDIRKAVETWAARVGLEPMLTRPAVGLSGGEKQKLALARALITEPRLVFLDEPCASLDGAATREIEALLKEANAAGTRLILSTHDMGQARRLADDILFLHHRKIHESGPAAEFFAVPKTAEARAFLKGDIVE